MQIRSKLFIIMISVVTISIVVPSVVALNTFTRSLETEITEELKVNALNAMDKLSRLMFERVADIRFLTDPGNVVISGSEDNFTIGEKVEYLRQVEEANKAYASISLYNTSGIKVGDTRSIAIGVNDSEEPFYRNAINGDIYYDQVPIFSRNLRQHVLHFSGPVYDENNLINGVLVLTFPLNKINEIMLEAGGAISNDADIDLLSDDGLLIYSNNDQASVLQERVTGLPIFDKLRNSTDRVESEISVDDQSSNRSGETIFIGTKDPGFLDYKGNNWSLILGVKTEDAFKSVSLLRNEFLIIAVVILSVFFVLIFIFARSISKPIIKLRDITNEVSKGNFDIEVGVQKSGGDELDQLSSSFENMRQTILARTKEVLKVNEELKLKDRLKDEFINVAAHELRTPIQPILGLCEVLRSKIKKDNVMDLRREEEQLLDVIVKNAKRLRGLAQEILDVTRIESKGFDLNLLRFNLVSLLSDIISDTKEQISKERQDLNLILELGGENTSTGKSNGIFVHADKDKIIQAISNLLTNAIKFTKNGTISVKVSINDQNNEVVTSIKDTGEGIDPSILPQLFTKFSSKSFEGIGLGLFITKNIVQAHGGRIWAENNSDEKGATFFFTLLMSQPSS
jgi:signal transduction histidine kinase